MSPGAGQAAHAGARCARPSATRAMVRRVAGAERSAPAREALASRRSTGFGMEGRVEQALPWRKSGAGASKTSLGSLRSPNRPSLAIGVRMKGRWMRLRCEDQEDSVAFPKTLFRSADTATGSGEQPEALRAVNRL